MAKCLRMVLFSLLAVAFMAGSALAIGSDPYVSEVEIASCEVAAANYFYEVAGVANTKKMGTICYTLGQNYNVNDRIRWTLTADTGTTTFEDAGEYFLVTMLDDTNPTAWSCNVYGDTGGATLLKAWNPLTNPTGKDLSIIEFRAIGGAGAGWVRRSSIMQSAFAEGVMYCLAKQCTVASTGSATQPVFADADNIGIDTTALGGDTGCCNRYYLTEDSLTWLQAQGAWDFFDKKDPPTAKKSWVMGSKRQFVGTKSDTNDLFDETIYCPDRRYFASGNNCDTYTKIICSTTEECGQTLCTWDTKPYAVTNVYTINDADVITMTVQATQTASYEDCLTATIAGQSQCSKNGDKLVCWLTGVQIKSLCPSFPTTSCPVQIELCTNGGCQLSPKWFKNVKDEFFITGGAQDVLWDISPKAQYQYAGIWGINGTQFIVPYLTTSNGFNTQCFLNSKSMSDTYIWADLFALQSCDSPLVTDKCFSKLLGVTNIPVGPLAANGQKFFEFAPTQLIPRVRDAANAQEAVDTAMVFTFVGKGVETKDRFAALVTVCNLDQYVGWKQGGSASFDAYTNDWPGGQNLYNWPTTEVTPNSSLSCMQAQGSGVPGKRTLPILTPLGMVWKN